MAVARPIEEVSEAAGPVRVSFENGGAFLSEVRGEVERYLASPHTRTRGRVALYAKSAVALPLLAVSWAVLMFVQPGLLLGLLCLLGCVVGAVLTGFCVQHDANHGAYFQSRRLNHLMGWSTDALLGFSSHAWRVKHNVAHHTYTNVDGYDDDISQTPFARMMPSQPSRPWYRLQHVYIWPLYSLMVIRWQIGADAAALVRRRIGKQRDAHAEAMGPRRARRGEGVLRHLGDRHTVARLSVVGGRGRLRRLRDGGEPRHGDDLPARPLRRGGRLRLAGRARRRTKRLWAVHEVESTVDFCPRNAVLTWVLGGLNFQIEHHLFPRVPHTHYPRIAEIVRRKAAEHGVRYTAQPSLRVALRSHQRHLRALGRLGLPVEIEMG